MNIIQIEKKLSCDLQDVGVPACLCPYIGENYAKGQILIVSGEIFISKNASLSTVDTPFALYENPSIFYKGKDSVLDQNQENEISVKAFVEDFRKFLLARSNLQPSLGFERSVNYNDFKTIFKADSDEETLFGKMYYTLSKNSATINDVAVHRFFLRPCVYNNKSDLINLEEFVDKYFTEDDKIHGVKMLRNVIDSLCPQKVFFSSKKIADVVSDTFAKIYPKTIDQFFRERKISTDLESPWDYDKKCLDRLLNGNAQVTNQKRLRLLASALVSIEEKLRLKSPEPNNELNELRAVVDNINAVVCNHELYLKNATRGKKRNISDEEREKRRERMKQARDKLKEKRDKAKQELV